MLWCSIRTTWEDKMLTHRKNYDRNGTVCKSVDFHIFCIFLDFVFFCTCKLLWYRLHRIIWVYFRSYDWRNSALNTRNANMILSYFFLYSEQRNDQIPIQNANGRVAWLDFQGPPFLCGPNGNFTFSLFHMKWTRNFDFDFTERFRCCCCSCCCQSFAFG